MRHVGDTVAQPPMSLYTDHGHAGLPAALPAASTTVWGTHRHSESLPTHHRVHYVGCHLRTVRPEELYWSTSR